MRMYVPPPYCYYLSLPPPLPYLTTFTSSLALANDQAYTGSTRTFAALHKSLIKLQKHALALARFRSNTTPEIAVLIPQEETFTKEGAQDQPPGLHVICMPFADDMRKPPKAITENLLGESSSKKRADGKRQTDRRN